jgi:hypothetical protein
MHPHEVHIRRSFSLDEEHLTTLNFSSMIYLFHMTVGINSDYYAK